MGYVEDNLMPGEQVIHRAQLHWAIFVGPAILVVLGLLSSFSFSQNGQPNYGCLTIAILAAIVWGLQAAATYFSTEFAVTNKRIIAKSGVLRRRSLELMLGKVESISVNQNLYGRLFNFGTLVVVGSGGTREGFPAILRPQDFRQSINAQIAAPN